MRSERVSAYDFTGQTVLVTGAGSGIGAATARVFAELGARLALADRNESSLDEIAYELTGLSGVHPSIFVYDQTDVGDVIRLSEWAGSVDVLVNNAGVLLTGPLEDQDDHDICTLIACNLLGPVLLAKSVGKGMLARGNGVIVNTTSQLAFCGAPERAIYASAKAGLAQFTRSTAAEWGPRGVRVVALAPGRTLTPLNATLLSDASARDRALGDIPLRRFGDAREMGRLIAFLASPLASYIAGQSVVADGGYVVAH